MSLNHFHILSCLQPRLLLWLAVTSSEQASYAAFLGSGSTTGAVILIPARSISFWQRVKATLEKAIWKLRSEQISPTKNTKPGIRDMPFS